MIIYAVATSESAGKLFIAGIVPGALLAAIMMGLVFIQAKRHQFPTQPKPTAKEFWDSFKDAWGGLLLVIIITSAILFSFLLTSKQIPQAMSAWVLAQNLEPWMFLLVVNLALLAVGQFMEPSSIVLILAPLFLPIAKILGIDPIHLGIIIVINMEIGMIHPPVGLNLFVASHLAKMGLTEVSLATLPWVGVMLLYLGLITYVPAISLWLPNLLYR